MAECWFRPHWFPIAACVLMPLTFLVTYLIAVFLGHVEADFPYISDTGTKPPESCIFGQFLNIGAVLVGITFYIRYKQVQEYSGEDTGGRSMCYINRAALSIGMLSALGISMVANFQETSVLVVHLAGAVLAFGLGTVYMILNTVLSYRLAVTPRWMCHLRAVLSFIAGLMFFCNFLFDSLAKKYYHGKDPTKWMPSDGGFTLHIISTASEWTLAFSMMFFFLTLYPEFKPLSFSAPEVSILIMRTESTSGLYTGGVQENV